MAKGNMLQGMARGKVGDVVFSRLNGEQISRVRNRHPKNPSTNPQLFQRAIMATVMLAYSQGMEIFDHSFQGQAKGEACMRRFMSLNAKILRTGIANDLANNSSNIKVCVRGSKFTAPNAYQVSEGDYPVIFINPDSFNSATGYKIPESTEGQKNGEYMEAHGLIAGDIYTFPIFVSDPNNPIYGALEDPAGAVFNGCIFGWVRLTVKNPIATAAASFADIFDVETSNTIENAALDFGSFVGISLVNLEAVAGSVAIIRSRKDQDLRSTSYMKVQGSDSYGITAPYLLDAWKKGTVSVGDSDLILEGGNI